MVGFAAALKKRGLRDMATHGVFETLRIELADGCATLRFDRPHGNAINPGLVADLLAAFDWIESDESVRGVLLASAHPRVFCPGLDLLELYPLDRPTLEAFLRDFCLCTRRLFKLARPVVAAVAGHAVAGGCVFALAADHRVLAREGASIGLNEIRIGLPLPWSVSILLRHAVDHSRLAEIAMLGRNVSGEAAVACGLVQELAPAERVEAVARERLADYAAKAPAAMRLIKAYLRMQAAETMERGDRERLKDFLDVWFSPPTRETLGAAVATLRDKEKERGGGGA